MAYLIFEYADDEARSVYDDQPPAKATAGSAGFDLRAMDNHSVRPGESVSIRTGIRLQMPAAVCGFILPRSGLSTKKGLIIPNSPGLIDSDYRGEILVCLHNLVESIRVIPARMVSMMANPEDQLYYGEKQEILEGERIAQIVFQPVLATTWKEGQLNETVRGDGGYGSTGSVE